MKSPKIRFQGFTDDWEQRKLAETASEFIGGGTPSTSVNEFWTGEIPWIQSSNLAENVVDRVAIDKKISENAILKTAAKKISSNSIAVVTRVGVGKLAFIPFEYATSQDFLSFSKLKVSPWFLVYLLSEKLAKWGNETQGTSIKGITKKELLSKKVLMPSDSMEEQAVGELLKKLDSTIALHQRKEKLLQEMKQGCLQKLFPQKGQNKPELRFSGFTDDWEQRKLADLFKIIDGDRGKNYPHESDFNESGYTLFLDTGNVRKGGFDFSSRKYITKDKDLILRSGTMNEGDFVLTSRGTLGNVALYSHRIAQLIGRVRINSAMLILRPKQDIDTGLLATILRGNAIDSFMKNDHVGSAQPHITKRDFSAVKVLLPQKRAEQSLVGSFFDKMDVTIALHQRQLEKLSQLKKQLLDRMFI
jgi:type I restriction enzyme S subunit